jgi:hypothetical protein
LPTLAEPAPGVDPLRSQVGGELAESLSSVQQVQVATLDRGVTFDFSRTSRRRSQDGPAVLDCLGRPAGPLYLVSQADAERLQVPRRLQRGDLGSQALESLARRWQDLLERGGWIETTPNTVDPRAGLNQVTHCPVGERRPVATEGVLEPRAGHDASRATEDQQERHHEGGEEHQRSDGESFLHGWCCRV